MNCNEAQLFRKLTSQIGIREGGKNVFNIINPRVKTRGY
jgi:hypothetical protein